MERVLFVCLGNICRSPMAEGLWRSLLARGGWPADAVDSAGTGGWHAGEGAHPGTVRVLRRVGADFPHAARQVVQADFDSFDRILAMDAKNLSDLRSLARPGCRARLHLVLEPIGGGDVPDPWGEGPEAFDAVHDLLARALDRWTPLLLTSGAGAGPMTR